MPPASLSVPPAFRFSYENFETYPKNLLHNSTHDAVLEAYQERLEDLDRRLFSNAPYNVRTLEYGPTNANPTFNRRDVGDEAELRDWIGDTAIGHLAQPLGGNIATRPDPVCRVVFLSAVGGRSRSPLTISRFMLYRILSYHQVMPEFLDFVSVFGKQDNHGSHNVPRGRRFSSFKLQCMLSQPPQLTAINDLGRSGRQYQMCYNLRGVSRRGNGIDVEQTQMDPQQAAFHHQFDVDTGRALWIAAKGNPDMVDRLDTASLSGLFIPNTPDRNFVASLEVHRRHCLWATEGWSWYLQWLEGRIAIEVREPLTLLDTLGVAQVDTSILQKAIYNQEKANEVVMILKSNSNILNCLQDFYGSLISDPHYSFPHKAACSGAVDTFSHAMQRMCEDFARDMTRAEMLVKESQDLKTLITEQLQQQASNRVEKLSKMTLKDSSAMRIITVVTLIYLPATFVSTFFSTDVIKYQNPNNDSTSPVSGDNEFKGSYSSLALERWCEVTFPLTILTLVAGWRWYVFDLKRKNKNSDSSP